MNKKILLAEDDRIQLTILEKTIIKQFNKEDLILTENGQQAAQAFEKHDIGIVITDIGMPIMDGSQLIDFLYKKHPQVPVIVITATDSVDERSFPENVVQVFVKPIPIKYLVSLASVILSQNQLSGSLKGISVGSVLQLIETEKKSCTLHVLSQENHTGSFYFIDGMLYDALFQSFVGEEAAYKMAALESPKFSINEKMPKDISFRRRIERSITGILMEAMYLKDEAKRDSLTDTNSNLNPRLDQYKGTHIVIDDDLRMIVSHLRLIEGFVALAALDANGKIILAHKSDLIQNFEETIYFFNKNQHTQDLGFGTIREALFQTDHWAILFRHVQDKLVGDMRFFLIMDKRGNQAMARVKMRMLLDRQELVGKDQ